MARSSLRLACARYWPGSRSLMPGRAARRPRIMNPAATPPQTVPEDTAPGRSGSSQEPLGKKLNRTDGVLHPPQGVDPGVAIPPPSTGSNMPVIPPPGTPGGNPAIEPK